MSEALPDVRGWGGSERWASRGEWTNAYEPPGVIDHSADRPVYKQLADLVRSQIQNGEFGPGQRLPAQKDYMQEHGLARDTVERAMAVLRNEGLIVIRRGGSRVRQAIVRRVLCLDRGKISARIPTDPERREYGIREGVALLVVTRDGHDEEIYPADKVEIQVAPDHAAVPDVIAERRVVDA